MVGWKIGTIAKVIGGPFIRLITKRMQLFLNPVVLAFKLLYLLSIGRRGNDQVVNCSGLYWLYPELMCGLDGVDYEHIACWVCLLSSRVLKSSEKLLFPSLPVASEVMG